MNARRRESRERLRAAHRGQDVKGKATAGRLEQCGVCKGERGKACAACRGEGWVRRTARRAAPERFPRGLIGTVGELVAAWAAIEADGMEGFLAADERAQGRRRRLDEGFLAALSVFRGELARLEFEDDVADALEQAKR